MSEKKEKFYALFKKAGMITSDNLSDIHNYVTELEQKETSAHVVQFEAALHIIQMQDEMERMFKNLKLIDKTVNSDASDADKITALKNGIKCIMDGKKYTSGETV